MAKFFRPSTREASLLSKIESSKERVRRAAISSIQDCIDPLSNAIAMKLIENSLVETSSKNSLEEQIHGCLGKLSRADDFDVDYKISPFRLLIPQPNIISLYLTAFVLENLLNHKDVVDIFGSDEEIYSCIDFQVKKFLPT